MRAADHRERVLWQVAALQYAIIIYKSMLRPDDLGKVINIAGDEFVAVLSSDVCMGRETM